MAGRRLFGLRRLCCRLWGVGLLWLLVCGHFILFYFHLLSFLTSILLALFLLTYYSRCPTRPKRHLPLSLYPRDPKRTSPHSHKRYPHSRTSYLYESFRDGSKDPVSQWLFGVGCVDPDCGFGVRCCKVVAGKGGGEAEG